MDRRFRVFSPVPLELSFQQFSSPDFRVTTQLCSSGPWRRKELTEGHPLRKCLMWKVDIVTLGVYVLCPRHLHVYMLVYLVPKARILPPGMQEGLR